MAKKFAEVDFAAIDEGRFLSAADDLYAVPPQTDLPAPVLLDRSTLERYAACPAQGLFAEKHPELCGGPAATAGQEAHEVIGWALGEWISSGEIPADNMEANARMARPDVQPDVLDSIRPVIWSITKLCRTRNPADILRYDGGEGERSGQLATELLPATDTRGHVLFTAEVDLLMATVAETVLRVIDWKTGRKDFTYTAVAGMFQAAAYSTLVHDNYPDVQRVEFQICQTRKNRWTAPVAFTKRDAADMRGRLLQAVEIRRRALAVAETCPSNVDAWPAAEKCRICPCLMQCPFLDGTPRKIASDPVAFARMQQIIDLQAAEDHKALAAWVDTHGPIEWDGGSYGRFPVAKPKKRPCTFKETP